MSTVNSKTCPKAPAHIDLCKFTQHTKIMQQDVSFLDIWQGYGSTIVQKLKSRDLVCSIENSPLNKFATPRCQE